MEWWESLILLILPIILTFIFGKLGIDQLKFRKWEGLFILAKEGVYWAKSTFPDNSGVQKAAAVFSWIHKALVQMKWVIADDDVKKAIEAEYAKMKVAAGEKIVGN